MSQLQALIFDLDGTLAETERDGHRIAFNRAFAEAGLNWEWSVALYGELLSVAGGKERLRHYITQYCSDWPAPEALDTLIANLHAAKTRHYRQLLSAGNIPLRPGVRRLLAEARSQGIRCAIATTSALANARALIETALAPEGMAGFELVAAGDIVPAKKPAPDIYFYVLDKMGLTPQDCLVFEDSEHGLAAATQAGLKTVVTVNAYTQHQDFSTAALVLNHLGEPEQPFTVLSGHAGNWHYFNLDLARFLVVET